MEKYIISFIILIVVVGLTFLLYKKKHKNYIFYIFTLWSVFIVEISEGIFFVTSEMIFKFRYLIIIFLLIYVFMTKKYKNFIYFFVTIIIIELLSYFIIFINTSISLVIFKLDIEKEYLYFHIISSILWFLFFLVTYFIYRLVRSKEIENEYK